MIANLMQILVFWSVFGVIRSIMNKRWFEIAVVERSLGKTFRIVFYRCILTIVSLALFIYIIIRIASLPDQVLFHLPLKGGLHGLWHVIQALPILIFFLISFISLGRIGEFFGIEQILQFLRGEHPKEFKYDTLIIKGIYQKIRHPMIVGFLLSAWLHHEWTWNLLFSNIFFSIYLIGATLLIEERVMLKEFGKDYQKYRETTPAFIPLKLKLVGRGLELALSEAKG